MEVRGYTKEKPRPPVTAWLLGSVLLFGLAALFLAAFEAFRQVMSPGQAFFSALLIETAAVVEAVAFARDRKGIAAAGLVVSLAVSATYNYIQVETAGLERGITNWWQLLSLAIGPLSALAMLSLSLGTILREHERRVAAWEADRQHWVDRERARAQRRADRREAEGRQVSGKLPEGEAGLPEVSEEDSARRAELIERCRPVFPDGFRFAAISRWDQLAPEQKAALAGLRGPEIRILFPGVNERSARNWAAEAATLAREGVRAGQAEQNGQNEAPMGQGGG
jgi:hypothetical protein